jgi:putative ATPase
MRMIDAGEDPMFIARRIVILAGEDVGLADPQALVIATAAQQATHLIGFPEGYFPLAEATVYLALAPKSDSLKRGLGELQTGPRGDPRRSGPAASAQRADAAHEVARVRQGVQVRARLRGSRRAGETYLPRALRERRYYVPTELGAEAELKRRLDALRRSVPGAGQARRADTSGSSDQRLIERVEASASHGGETKTSRKT